jgi:hypothetical protein
MTITSTPMPGEPPAAGVEVAGVAQRDVPVGRWPHE